MHRLFRIFLYATRDRLREERGYGKFEIMRKKAPAPFDCGNREQGGNTAMQTDIAICQSAGG